MAGKKAPSFVDWGTVEKVDAWPTGSLFLDWLIGDIGGLPKGRIVECYGPESSGKTTLFLQTAAYIWNTLGIPSHFADFEDAFDPRYAKSLGLSPEGLHLSECNDTLENYLEELQTLLAGKNQYALTIVDSVASLRTESDLKGAVDDRSAGMNRARILTQNLAKLTHPLSETGLTLCLVNQTRDFIDTTPGFKPPGMVALQPKQKTPGGRGIKFYASLRIEFDPTAEIKVERMNPLTREVEKVAIGKKVWLKVTKNKVSPPPWRKARLEIRDGMGFDLANNLLDFAVTHEIIEKGGAGKHTFPGEFFATGEPWSVGPLDGWSGADVAAQVIRENDGIRTALERFALDRLHEAEDQVREDSTLGLSLPGSDELTAPATDADEPALQDD